MRRSAVVGLAVLVAALAIGSPALATRATSAQVRALARAARSDRTALARLRRIDRVDGRPVRLRRALATRGRALDARLAVLARAAPAPQNPPAARGDARAILSQPRYRGSRQVPRPFHGVLHWIYRQLDRLAGATSLRRLVHWLDRHVPGGRTAVETIAAALVVALAAFVTLRMLRRRAAVVEDAEPVDGRPLRTAAALERAATEAEDAGDFERALRLRFQAGIARLGRIRVIPARASLTNGEIRRRVRLPEFERLAADFDEVVYGRRAAQPRDLERARAEWPRVLEKARAR